MAGSLVRILLLLSLALVVLSADYYKTLGVKKNASDKEIKKAYRKLAKQYHPDKTTEASAAQKFLDVGRAFEVLSSKDTRAIYDKHGEAGLNQQQQQGGGGGFHDPFDIFRNAFGGGGQQQQRKGNNMVAEVEIELEAVYKGDSLTFNVARKQICDECDGTGARDASDVVDCGTCGGRGIRLVQHQIAPGFVTQVQAHCDKCAGRGKITKHLCGVCHGNRIVDSNGELNVHIDRGVPEGTELVFPGEADESPDFAAGDVVVRFKTKKAVGGFERKESNLYWKESLSLAETLLGFKKSVRGLDGHDIIIQRSGPTQPGFVQIIKGEGLPVYHSSGYGDLYVEYSVVLPVALTPKQHKTLSTALRYTSPHAASHGEL